MIAQLSSCKENTDQSDSLGFWYIKVRGVNAHGNHIIIIIMEI